MKVNWKLWKIAKMQRFEIKDHVTKYQEWN